jgi:hypothetical protein
MSPSDSLSTRRDFALGLYPPPSPNVGRRGGSPQFRIRLSLRARFHTPGVSCAPPVSGTVCCLRPGMTGSATPPFGSLSHEAAKFTLSHWARKFAPLARDHTASAGPSTLRSGMGISPQYPEPATRRSGAYRDGTHTRKSDAAPTPDGPDPVSFKTHHARDRTAWSAWRPNAPARAGISRRRAERPADGS